MKRIHSLIQLGKAQPSVESNADDAPVVTQPIEGQPTVASTSDVLSDEQKAAAAQQQADEQTPADGSIPATDVPGVAVESGQESGVTAPVATETNPTPNNTVDTGDGSQPASAGDVIDNKDSRADLGQSVGTESQEAGVVAPVATETKPALDNKVDTGDGSQPATPGDAAGDPEKRADMPVGGDGKPAELAPELEQQVLKAPQQADVAADPNNPDNDNKTGGDATPTQTTSTENSEQTGGAVPAGTTSTEQPAVPSTEDLSPSDLAQVATVAAAVGAATGKGETPAEAAAGAVAEEGAIAGSEGAGTPAPDTIPAAPAPVDASAAPAADAAAEGASTGPADQAAQAAADTVAQGPTGDTPPGPNAGDAAATPADAAQVAADLIAANPDTAAEVAQAIDTVADAAVAATQGTPAPTEGQTDQGEAQAAAADAAQEETEGEQGNADADDAAAAEAALKEELDDSDTSRKDDDEDLDDIDDITDDVNASQESLNNSLRMVIALENFVETALAKGGLSDDAAEMLQTVTNNVSEDQDLDPTDLGLESLAYADRRNATDYALDRLRHMRAGLESELTVSNEGFFDLFRSFSSKMKDWVASSRRNIAAAKSAIKDKNKTATVRLPGEEGDFATIAQRSHEALADCLGEYGKRSYASAGVLTKLATEMADGDNNYESVAGEIDKIQLGYPKGFTELAPKGMDDGKATPPLLGDVTLALCLDARDSEADSFKVREHHDGEVTGAQVLAALEDADKIVQAVAGFISSFDNQKKLSKGTDKVKVTGAAFLASALGPAALLSADYRRLLYRNFTSLSDPQRKKAGEVMASFELVKEAASVSRKYVAAVLAIAERVQG